MTRLQVWIISFVIMGSLATAQWAGAYPQGKVDLDNPQQVRSTMALKKYMGHFGTLVAGMEIMRAKEKKPDWEAISLTLKDMDQTLQQMQQADKAGNYKAFTSVLEKNLKQVQKYGEAKDPKVYEAFDELTETCFKCHAVHRPGDFLIPKEKNPRISDEPKTSYLFEKLN